MCEIRGMEAFTSRGHLPGDVLHGPFLHFISLIWFVARSTHVQEKLEMPIETSLPKTRFSLASLRDHPLTEFAFPASLPARTACPGPATTSLPCRLMQGSRYTIKSAAHCSSADCSARSSRKKDDNRNWTLPNVELTLLHFQSCLFFSPANFVG